MDCLKLYRKEKVKTKLALERVHSRICLTSDVWTSSTSEGYISLTSHYVDENWVLQSKIINFCHIPPPHSGNVLSEKVYGFIKEWGIEKKIFSLTLDNASNNDKMEDILKTQLSLQGVLLCGGDFFHVRCCAHILNLIVQEGLKVASEALQKIRESVKYIKGSEGKRIKFGELAEQFGVRTVKGLRLDVSTRWNSTFLMLESALIYRLVFGHLALIDPNYKYHPSEEEWDRAEKICKFLKPFYDITTLFSGSKYPTANLYLQNVWKIQLCLIEEMESRDEVVSSMARQMKPKFDKYWDSYSIVLAIAAILDPRFKFPFVEFCYKRLGAHWDPYRKLEIVRREMYKLFEAYEVQHSSKVTMAHSSIESGLDPHSLATKDVISEFDNYESEFVVTEKSELDLYLQEPRLDRIKNLNLDILEHWKSMAERYPILSLMARDILSIPITTVASESAFSIGSKVLNKYRSSLRPDNAESLICTRTCV
ncbi:hypothetical protein K2173_015510 [Erythroxylum novogranatense]|uniref:Transposase n=1 Tax=Erythroxylum novogranatense TaxID=1862640 RepID=A0AAV8SSS3_9ROSI|nr:hypothetical protein K2173_015510 [Erythroxylum novogranatense]